MNELLLHSTASNIHCRQWRTHSSSSTREMEDMVSIFAFQRSRDLHTHLCMVLANSFALGLSLVARLPLWPCPCHCNMQIIANMAEMQLFRNLFPLPFCFTSNKSAAYCNVARPVRAPDSLNGRGPHHQFDKHINLPGAQTVKIFSSV